MNAKGWGALTNQRAGTLIRSRWEGCDNTLSRLNCGSVTDILSAIFSRTAVAECGENLGAKENCKKYDF